MNWDSLVPINKSTLVKVDMLNFDTNNPRFTPDKQPENNTDQAIITMLTRTADLAELIQSISTSGYINIEPLIVVVRDSKLVVLEGNRRLAALKSLRNHEYARQARLDTPGLSQEVRQTLEDVLVYRVEKEDDARALIGFKHINGPQAWDAYAKAKYAGQWLDSQKGKREPLSLLDIANRMGDKHSTIHRMVTALYVLEQAETNDIYSIEDRQRKSFSFSHLYTGLSSEEFTDYLGMERRSRNEDPVRDPVPVNFYEKLRTLLVWLYGSKQDDIQPVVKSQNPDLGILRDVLRSKAAIRELEERGDLAAAVITATPKYLRFSKHLIEANGELQKALETLDGFDRETQPELIEVADSAMKRIRIIVKSMDSSEGDK